MATQAPGCLDDWSRWHLEGMRHADPLIQLSLLQDWEMMKNSRGALWRLDSTPSGTVEMRITSKDGKTAFVPYAPPASWHLLHTRCMFFAAPSL